jgi:hypothetical protein
LKHTLPLFASLLLAISLLSQASAQIPAASSASSSAPAGVNVSRPQPGELTPYAGNWQVKGSGVLRFFGFKVYDATLWLPANSVPFSFERPLALEMRYATAVKASDIVNTSLIEATRISGASPAQVTAWTALMRGLFVDVQAGDRLTGVHLPGVGARFFMNGKPLGESGDVEFSEAFFRIWLDPKARKPDLRASLLGLVP